MKNILFPTEFSDHAPQVFRYAAELAYFFKARLTVLHAFNQPEVKLKTKEELDEMAEKTSQQMIDFVNTHLPEEYQDLPINYVAKSGIAETVILEAALEENINLIVMGMTGKFNTLDKLFGNTALAVLNKADCPVLMVPAKTKFEGIDNLVFTTNFEFRDLIGIEYLKKWITTFEAPVHCLHVIEKGENELEALKNMSILQDTFRRQKRILFELEKGDLYEEIAKFRKSKKADIVAMMSHKRNFISRLTDTENVVEVMAGKIQVPLLVIKDNAYEVRINDAVKWLDIANSIA